MKNKINIEMRHLNLMMSFVVSVLLCIFIYKFNVTKIDQYNYFIFGDTIFSRNNKSIDLKIIYYFCSICAVLFIASYKYLPDKNMFSLLWRFDSNVSLKYPKKILFTAISLSVALYFLYCSSELFKSIYHINKFHLVSLIFTSVAIIYLWKIKKLKFIQLTQLMLSFSPLLLLNEIQHHQGNLIHFPLRMDLKILIWMICLVLLFTSIQDAKKNEIILSSTLLTILLLSVGGVERFYIPDEYHFGEVFTSYHQLFELDQSSYLQYIPTKGWTHLLPDFVNHLFFDGSYINTLVSYRFTTIFLSFMLVLILRNYISNVCLAILSLSIAFPINDQYYPILIGLFVFSSKFVWKTYYHFLLTYMAFCLTFFFYYNAFGVAFAASIFPLFAIILYKSYQERLKPNKSQVVIFLLIISIAILNHSYIFNSLLYCIENARYNLFYWGNYGGLAKYIHSNLWLLIYFGWFYIFFTQYKSIQNNDRVWLFFLLLFPLFILSYMEGRADGGFVRARYVSAFYSIATICFIFSYSNCLTKRHKVIMLCLAVIVFATSAKKYLRHVSPQMFKYYESINIDNDLLYVKDSDIPNIGRGFIKPDIYKDLENEYRLIQKLSKDETFLIVDAYLTQSARYSIFNKKIPTISHSVLNIPSLKSQQHELKKVKASRVKIVRVSGGLKRYQMFYKYFLEGDYQLASYAGRKYLIENQLYDRLLGEGMIQAAHLSDIDLIMYDLTYLPVKWGSAVSNENISRKIHTTTVPEKAERAQLSDQKQYLMGDNARFRFKQTQTDIIQADFLFIDLSLNGKKECDVKFLWNDESDKQFGNHRSVKFKIHSGMNVLPLSNNYLWFQSNQIHETELRINNCSGATVQFNALDFAFYGDE